MKVEEKAKAFAELGSVMHCLWKGEETAYSDDFQQVLQDAYHKNGWFTGKFVLKAVKDWSELLTYNRLKKWIDEYPDLHQEGGLKVGLILAGNIPMVGFHDILSVLITGNKVHGKMSSKDAVLLPFIMEVLKQIEPRFKNRIELDEHLRFDDIDAVIATGSDNSAKYFDYYFGKYPNIIRKNRTGVAVLTGNETFEELKLLGEDIFTYFGLGCRNVSKIYAPAGFEINRFFEAVTGFGFLNENKKYMNNYEYNRTLYLLDDTKGMLDNNLVIVKEDTSLHAPTGVVHIEYYEQAENVLSELNQNRDEIQCVVSRGDIPFGQSQKPKLHEYADEKDTVAFLTSLKSEAQKTI